jgi:hypothetical protein
MFHKVDHMKMTSVAVILAAALSSCRTGLRPQTNPGDPVGVEIKVVGMKDADLARSELVYTLSGCGAGNTSGTKGTENLVNFMTQNLRKDDRCDLKVLADKADVGVASWFSDPGLLYDARRIAINSDSGKLSGVAFVQQLYSTPPSIQGVPASTVWQLEVPVTGPKAFSGLCTCSISCQPSLANNVTKLDVQQVPNAGTCSFANVTKADAARTQCGKLMVQCGSEFFVGSWPNGAIFDGNLAKLQTAPALPIVAGVPEEISDTSIEVVIPK